MKMISIQFGEDQEFVNQRCHPLGFVDGVAQSTIQWLRQFRFALKATQTPGENGQWRAQLMSQGVDESTLLLERLFEWLEISESQECENTP